MAASAATISSRAADASQAVQCHALATTGLNNTSSASASAAHAFMEKKCVSAGAVYSQQQHGVSLLQRIRQRFRRSERKAGGNCEDAKVEPQILYNFEYLTKIIQKKS